MDRESFGSAFAAVDRSADPAELRGYLERVRAVPSVNAAKHESFELLRVAPGQRTLDLGCGAGDDLLELAEIVGPSGRAVGVDNSETLVAEARRRTPPERPWVEFVCGEAIAIPFEDASFDSCRSDRTIQHVPEAGAALAELARVTVPGGVVVISEMLNALDLGGGELGRLASELSESFWSAQERRGWIGFLLPLLLSRAGFTEVALHRHTEEIRSFEEVALLLRLPELAAAAVGSGELTETAARRFLDDFEGAFAAGKAVLRSEFIHFEARTRPAVGGGSARMS